MPTAGNHHSFEQHVSDVHLKFLYEPRSLIALGVVLIALFVAAFAVDSESLTTLQNTQIGVSLACAFFVLVGTLVFPAGPFIRPHPIVWRITFGVGVLYELFIIFILFQKKDDGRAAFRFFDDSLGRELEQETYAADCSFTWKVLEPMIFDRFVIAHFGGWVAKAVVLQDPLILWTMSVTWEFVEIAARTGFANFRECWFDSFVLDVLGANALGIYVGGKVVQWLEMRVQRWQSYRDLPSAGAKLKRVVMQFTPESWMHVQWRATSSIKRFLIVLGVVLMYFLLDFNAFWLKHVLYIPSSSSLNVWRLIVFFGVGLPGTRQAYVYATDPTCKRFGTFSWLTITMLFTEVMLCAKYGKGMFPRLFDYDDFLIWGPYFALLAIVLVGFLVRGRRGGKGLRRRGGGGRADGDDETDDHSD